MVVNAISQGDHTLSSVGVPAMMLGTCMSQVQDLWRLAWLLQIEQRSHTLQVQENDHMPRGSQSQERLPGRASYVSRHVGLAGLFWLHRQFLMVQTGFAGLLAGPRLQLAGPSQRQCNWQGSRGFARI